MAQKYSYIDDITPLKENVTIKIRIIRLWKPPSFDNPNEDDSIEMVFLDEKGSKIQASVKKSLIRRFANVLEEGQSRIIANFGVGQSTGNYRPTQHPYKINFFFTTSVQICDDLPISLHGFSFVSLDDILSKKLDDKYLVDIIGQVMAVGPLETNERNGKLSKKIMMELNDKGDAKIKCTLWDNYADEASNFLTERELSPTIIIIQFAKIKEWKGEITLSNSLFSTRIFFNEDINEVNSFKLSLPDNSGNTAVVRSTELSTQNSISITDEFLQLHERKSLDEIRDVTKPAHYIVLDTIVCAQLEHGWYYLACKKCNKKVSKVEETSSTVNGNGEGKFTKFICKKCDKSLSPEKVIPKYKVQVRVIDESGSASFVMFDREVVSIVKKTVYDWKDSSPEDNDDSYPEELLNIVGRKLLFKIEVSDYNIKQNFRLYTVNKICDSEELIQSFMSSSTTYQDVNSDAEGIENLGLKTTSATEKDSISCTGDNDQVSELSPIIGSKKRSIEPNSSDFETQMSATKKKFQIKIEKDDK